jgi:hypothetical protein
MMGPIREGVRVPPEERLIDQGVAEVNQGD